MCHLPTDTPVLTEHPHLSPGRPLPLWGTCARPGSPAPTPGSRMSQEREGEGTGAPGEGGGASAPVTYFLEAQRARRPAEPPGLRRLD